MIGLPGDRISIDAGQVYVNDQPLAGRLRPQSLSRHGLVAGGR